MMINYHDVELRQNVLDVSLMILLHGRLRCTKKECPPTNKYIEREQDLQRCD